MRCNNNVRQNKYLSCRNLIEQQPREREREREVMCERDRERKISYYYTSFIHILSHCCWLAGSAFNNLLLLGDPKIFAQFGWLGRLKALVW